MSIIVGDTCRPKYFGARKLALQLGQKREVQFYWQASDADHYLICLSRGLSHIQNSGQLEWMTVTGNKAAFFPDFQDLYQSNSYLSLYYRAETFLLELSVSLLYRIPTILPVNAAEVFTGNGADYRGF